MGSKSFELECEHYKDCNRKYHYEMGDEHHLYI